MIKFNGTNALPFRVYFTSFSISFYIKGVFFMKIARTMLLMLLFTFLVSPINLVYGAENTGADYSVKPILPNNQWDKDKSFYDLRVTPGQKETLQLQINNYSDNDQEYNI